MPRSDVYAALEDVLAKVPYFRISATNAKPNASQVADFIAGISDEIDAKLERAGYSVPIPTTATRSRDLLNQWTAIGAGMETAAAMPQGEDSKHLKYLERRWNAILKSLDEGFSLPDEDLRETSSTTPRFGRVGAADSTEPYFEKDETEVGTGDTRSSRRQEWT